jgi:cytochrome c2
MSRSFLTSIVAIGLAVFGLHVAARAGGWSVATLDDWPTQVVANQPFTISFSLRQHGQRLIGHRTGSVEFQEEEKVGPMPLQFEVRPALAERHYTTTITLPIAGTWHWRIDVFGKHAMPPLTAYAEPRPAAQTSDPPRQAEIGQVLFVAKGCSTCHRHPAVAGSRSIGVIGPGSAVAQTAPPLPNALLTAEYLRRWLSDPKAVKPTTLMPDLGLKQNEVEALTAFLMDDSLTWQRDQVVSITLH